jgi:hypothetical protein
MTVRFAGAWVAACVLGSVPALAAVTGSGTVGWSFTSFVGPYSEYVTGQPGVTLSGVLNGVPIVPVTNTGDQPGNFLNTFGYHTGGVSIAGGPSSVSLVYNAPDYTANIIAFTPSSFSNVALGQDFKLGTLSFTNGQWFGAGEVAGLNTPTNLYFTMQTYSNSGAAFNQTIHGDVVLTVNSPYPNDITTLAGQQAEADWITLQSSAVIQPLGAFRVYEINAKPPGSSNVGTVDLYGHFNSLDLVRFDNVQGGGFLTSSSEALPSSTGGGTGGGNGGGTTGLPIPEPGTLGLLLAGLGALGSIRRR